MFALSAGCGCDPVRPVPVFVMSDALWPAESVPGLAAGAGEARRKGCRAGQARAQARPERVRPALTRVRRFSPAHRLCSQALFLAVPM